MTLPAPLPSGFEKRLAVASSPDETRELENISAAARAYYHEQQDYEGMVKATEAYFLSRRKTTELILQDGGNTYVTYGFTKMQWHRRMKELRVDMDNAIAYFDECILHGWNPSIAGVLSFDAEPAEDVEPFERDKTRLINLLRDMVAKYGRAAVDAVIRAFEAE